MKRSVFDSCVRATLNENSISPRFAHYARSVLKAQNSRCDQRLGSSRRIFPKKTLCIDDLERSEMKCKNCQTILPDEAIACWKCGTKVERPATTAPRKKEKPDILIVAAAFIIAAVFFACLGWSIPFMVWGMITSSAKNSQWSDLMGVVSGISFVATTIAIFGGVWWGSYWLIKNVTVKSSGK